MATHPTALRKHLGLSDLLFFGITHILGSGAVNLVAPTVYAAGSTYPAVIGGVTALLLGSSTTFAGAIREYGTNNSVQKLIQEQIGSAGQVLGTGAYLLYNVFAIALGLVFITRIFCADRGAAFQIMVAIQLVIAMVVVAAYGIDVNKTIIDSAGAFYILLLVGVGLAAVWAVVGKGTYVPNLGTAVGGETHNIGRAILYVFFILAGFDVLMTFTEETKDTEDVGRAFNRSIGLSAVILLGCVFAFTVFVPLRGRADTLMASPNFIGDIVSALYGTEERAWANWLVAGFILAACFVQFVGTSRWIYSGATGWADGLRTLNSAAAPHKIIMGLGAIITAVIAINNVDRLVGFADIFLVVLMALVGWSAARRVWTSDKRSGEAEKAGERVPWVESGTTLGLFGVLWLAIKEVWSGSGGSWVPE